MKSYQDWLTEQKNPDKRPRSRGLKKDGGVAVDQEVAKRVDLIVLPSSIEGTNCGNCEYMEKSGDMGFCKNDKVRQWVTSRMCCELWNHPDVKRSWK